MPVLPRRATVESGWAVIVRAPARRRAPSPAGEGPARGRHRVAVPAEDPATVACRPVRRARLRARRGRARLAGGTGWRCRRKTRPQWRAVRCVERGAVRRSTRVGDRPGRGPARIADARRFRYAAGDREVVGVAGEPDARIGPDIEAGSPAGVRDQLAHRPIRGDVGKGTAARAAAGAALGADHREILWIAVGVRAEQQRAVEDQRLTVGAAGGVEVALVEGDLGAHQGAGEGRGVGGQQPGCRLEQADRCGDVRLAHCEQLDATVGEADDGGQQVIERRGVVGDAATGGGGGGECGQDPRCGNAIRIADRPHGLPIGAQRVGAFVHLGKDGVGVGDGLPDQLAVAAQALSQSGQHRLQLGWVDLLEDVGQVAEQGVDLGADVVGVDDIAGRQSLRAGIGGVDEFDELGAEQGSGSNLGAHVHRKEVHLVGFDIQGQLYPGAVGADVGHPADLHTTQLDLRSAVHHQTGPIRSQRHRCISPQGAGEQGGRRGDHRRGGDDEHQCPPSRVQTLFALVGHRAIRTGGSCRTARRWTVRSPTAAGSARSARSAPNDPRPHRLPRARRWRYSRSRCAPA